LLRNVEIHGIVIAASAAQHFEQANRALHAGKDVLVEKPLALQVEEREELVEVARKDKRTLMVDMLRVISMSSRDDLTSVGDTDTRPRAFTPIAPTPNRYGYLGNDVVGEE
jgi:hypothetical protein